jgi:hypothetical protein
MSIAHWVAVVVLFTSTTFPSVWNNVCDLGTGRGGDLGGVGGGNGGTHVIVLDVLRCFSMVLRCTLTRLALFSAQSLATEMSGDCSGVSSLNCVSIIWHMCCSFGVSSRSSSLYSVGRCQIRACPLVCRYLCLVNLLVCVSSSSGSIVASAARKDGPLMNFFGQLISRLNCWNQGYLNIIQSLPRSMIRNLSMCALPPWNMAMGSQYLIHPPQLSVPSTFLIPIGHSRSLGLIPSLWAVRISIQFLLAPLSMSAFSLTIPQCVTNSNDNQISLATKFMYTVCGGSAHAEVDMAELRQNPVG